MGADHIERLARRIVGAEVSVVVDADISRATRAIEAIPSAVAESDIGQTLDRKDINAGNLGELLMLHCSHRNPEAPPEFTNEMLINDSVVHEFDAIR